MKSKRNCEINGDLKKCKQCLIFKEKNEFFKRDGICKFCIKENRRVKAEIRDIDKLPKDYKKCNMCGVVKNRSDFKSHSVFCKDPCQKIHNKQYREQNYESIIEVEKINYEKNKDKISFRNNEYKKRKRKSDPIYKFMSNFSNYVYINLRNQNFSKNNNSCREWLPSGSPEKYIEHIELQFISEMSWENHGKTWHIDHIIPQSLLKYSSYDDLNFKICWDKENLKPLLKEENFKKSNKLTEEAKILLKKLTKKYIQG